LPNTPQNGRHLPPHPIDITTVAARIDALTSAGICPRCQHLIAPLTAEVKALLAEAIRLRDALTAARLESANRLAAMRAALSAARDGVSDPLDYLRWELPEASAPNPDPGRGRR